MCMRALETSEKKKMEWVRKLMFPIKQREEKRKRKRKNTDNTVEMFT